MEVETCFLRQRVLAHDQGKNMQLLYFSYHRIWGLRACAKSFTEKVGFMKAFEQNKSGSITNVFWEALLSVFMQCKPR